MLQWSQACCYIAFWLAVAVMGKGSFDYTLKTAGPIKVEPIVIPFKRHKRLNYWLCKPPASILCGCVLGERWAALYLDSTGQCYGTKVSYPKLRACRNRNQHINKEIERLLRDQIKTTGFENLPGIKHGKKKNRSKNFRRMIAPRTYHHALTRIEHLAWENRVLPVSYNLEFC